MNRRTHWIAFLLVVAVAGFGCSAYRDLGNDAPPEGEMPDGFRNYAASESQRSMDREVCWQGIDQEQAAEDGGVHAAYEACMAEKGWGPKPSGSSQPDSR